MKIVRRKLVDDSHLSFIADPILRQLLAARGIKEPSDLDNSLKQMLSPYSMLDLDKAANIIAQSIINREHIMIAGDYDIDGMTGTALGVRCLKAFGLPEQLISYYVPSRYDDGYGLNKTVVDRAHKAGVQLIITVDNGIAAFDAVAHAKEQGIKVVVTDHHEVQENIPVADAVVDHKRKGDTFASKHLCGVGVLFYVMIGTRAKLIEEGYYQDTKAAPNMSQFLDLVTLGTIGDVMSFDANNRRLIKAGLKRIHKGQCSPGLLALLDYLKIDCSKVKIKTISFDLCPRFNAATRIRIAQNPAIMTLLSDDYNSALIYAKQLDMCNKRRMDHEKVMLSRAMELYKEQRNQAEIAASKSGQGKDASSDALLAQYALASEQAAKATEDPALNSADLMDIEDAYDSFDEAAQKQDYNAGIVLYDPTFLTGILGLVANRIKERYKKPSMVFGCDEGAKVDDGINLMSAVDNCNDELNASSQTVPSGELNITPAPLSFNNAESTLSENKDPNALADGMRIAEVARIRSAASGILSSIDKAENVEAESKKKEAVGQRKIVGSARSVPGIDMMKVFAYIKEREPNIFIACGGHAVAAGATIRECDAERFRYLFDEACAAVREEADSEVCEFTDCDLPDSYLCVEFARDLELFGPWGKSFEEPRFDGIFLIENSNILANRHLKLRLRSLSNRFVDGIKFRANIKEKSLTANMKVRVIYTLGVDRYYANERLQMNIEAIEPV